MACGDFKFCEACFDELSLFVRQLAWLHAVPEQPTRKVSDKRREARKSRWEQMQKDGIAADLPDAGAAEYLIGYLFEVGPAMQGGMASAVVTYEEMRAWMRTAGVELSPWEARTLRRLSNTYVAESHLATAPSCPPPFSGTAAISSERRAIVAKKLEAYFG